MPPRAAVYFLHEVRRALVGESVQTASAKRAAWSAFNLAAESLDVPGMIQAVRTIAPGLVAPVGIDDGERFTVTGFSSFMRWRRSLEGGRRQPTAKPSRAAIARLIPSPDNPRRSISRQQVSRWAVALERTLKRSPKKRRTFAALFAHGGESKPAANTGTVPRKSGPVADAIELCPACGLALAADFDRCPLCGAFIL